MRLAQVRQNEHHQGPDTNKERDDEQQDLPLCNGHVPEETPVSAIRLDPNRVSAKTTSRREYVPHSANSPGGFQMQGT